LQKETYGLVARAKPTNTIANTLAPLLTKEVAELSTMVAAAPIQQQEKRTSPPSLETQP